MNDQKAIKKLIQAHKRYDLILLAFRIGIFVLTIHFLLDFTRLNLAILASAYALYNLEKLLIYSTFHDQVKRQVHEWQKINK